MGGRVRLKLGELSLQIFPKNLRENRTKYIRFEYLFKCAPHKIGYCSRKIVSEGFFTDILQISQLHHYSSNCHAQETANKPLLRFSRQAVVLK